jgi:hypothetical protein
VIREFSVIREFKLVPCSFLTDMSSLCRNSVIRAGVAELSGGGFRKQEHQSACNVGGKCPCPISSLCIRFCDILPNPNLSTRRVLLKLSFADSRSRHLGLVRRTFSRIIQAPHARPANLLFLTSRSIHMGVVRAGVRSNASILEKAGATVWTKC